LLKTINKFDFWVDKISLNMNFNWISRKLRMDDIFQILFFGLISYLFGLVNFSIPRIDGAVSNLLEIPLLICIFHVRKLWIYIGICLISSFATPQGGSYLSSFMMHSISIIMVWFMYNYILKLVKRTLYSCITWIGIVIIYYLFLLLPLMIITNYYFGLNINKGFYSFYWDIFLTIRLELIASVIITSLYYMQFRLRLALMEHKDELELIVKKRTEELTVSLQELKSAQEQLVQSEKMASLGTLTAGIAHEINNPLNFISGGISIITNLNEENKVNTSAEFKLQYDNAINIVLDGLNRITGIVKALMSFSYKGTPRLTVFDLNEIIDNTLLFLNCKIPKEVIIKKNYNSQLMVPIFAEKIHQVLINIFENALFEFDISTNIEKVITISTNEENNKAVIKIFNTGRNIPENQIKKIFDPFFTTKDPGKGIGLGLSICYTLIQEHNGSIYAVNNSEGVCFIIELPIK